MSGGPPIGYHVSTFSNNSLPCESLFEQLRDQDFWELRSPIAERSRGEWVYQETPV
jgi:hypothetical protein